MLALANTTASGSTWNVRCAPVAVGTIVAKRRLAEGRVLARSLARHHPEVPCYALLADEVEGVFDPAAEPFRLLELAELAIPGAERLAFRYDQQALSYALTPHLLEHLLDRGHERVAFIKQESFVVGRLDPVFERLGRHAVVLTPHLLSPPRGPTGVDRELSVLQAGDVNGGLVGVSESPVARRFLAWWQERVATHCRHAVGEGLHFEQRWLALAQSLFEGVHLLRDEGCNVGHWNLPEREVEQRGDQVLVNGRPAGLIRFSGYDPDRPEALTRHFPDRLRVSDIGAGARVLERYRDSLEAEGRREAAAWPYAFDRFDDGVPVPDLARVLYAELDDAAEGFGDPFRTAPPPSWFGWLNGPADDGSPTVTRLWDEVHRRRPDLREVFPEHLGADREAFLAWARDSGRREHDVPDALLPGAPER